ncbi:MAG TPA: YafY family transcriptional regulator [Devosia sp.]|nr:YafY family transcriptional regulator [Devosia sp.]
MRRADRLLQIIQILRRENRPVTCARMAEELEVSERTLYRDMVSLQASGVPVRGEAGIGYVLEDGYHLPPLMFSESELEAIMLGARMVEGRVDQELTRAARDVVAKISAIVPPALKPALLETPLFAPHWVRPRPHHFDMADLRAAIRGEREVRIDYVALDGGKSTRIIWPFSIGLFPDANMITAWCTLREDFRHFRTGGIRKMAVLETAMGQRRSRLFHLWKKTEFANTGDPERRPGARIAGVK